MLSSKSYNKDMHATHAPYTGRGQPKQALGGILRPVVALELSPDGRVRASSDVQRSLASYKHKVESGFAPLRVGCLGT